MSAVKHLLQKLLRPKNKKDLALSSPVRDVGSRSSPAPSSSSASSHDHRDKLRMVFAEYDTDGDGQISLAELESVARALGNPDDPEAETAAMMEAADLDGDGFISFDEFACLMQVASGTRDEDLRLVFAAYDQNGDGVITAEELHCVLRRVTCRNGKDGIDAALSIPDCRRMIAAVDQDGDGVVNFHEFAAMMEAAVVCCC